MYHEYFDAGSEWDGLGPDDGGAVFRLFFGDERPVGGGVVGVGFLPLASIALDLLIPDFMCTSLETAFSGLPFRRRGSFSPISDPVLISGSGGKIWQ